MTTLATQPGTVNGSPETIVDRGIDDGAFETDRWADRFVAAVRRKRTAGEIAAALDRVAATQPLRGFAGVVEDGQVHGAMLGALDAHYEAERDAVIAPARFAASASDKSAGFASRGVDRAAEIFDGRAVVSRDVFDTFSALARRQAFTIAGLTNRRMLDDTKRELVRQITSGADLREFWSFVDQRLTSAGWRPANPSHVETIFRTNVLGAYNGGRFAQQSQPDVLAARPFWQWIAVGDDRTRPAHKQANGRILSADDSWWRRAYPPGGYNCRCRCVSRSRAQARGRRVYTGAEMPRDLPDRGWDKGGFIAGLLAA